MSEININREFADFGKYCYYTAILLILSIFIPFIGIVLLYFYYMALKVIKRINSQLNNENLEQWRSKMTIILVMQIIFIPVTTIINIYFSFMMDPGMDPTAMLAVLTILLIILIGTLIIMGIFQMKAWNNLNIFFDVNRNMFPEILVIDCLNGTKKLRTAGKCFLLFFLIITIIIGYILSIIGYFKLAHLRNLEAVSAEMPMVQPAPAPEPAAAVTPGPPEMAEAIEFCGNCGTKLESSWSVCPECGSPVGGEVIYQPTIEQPYEPKKGKTYGSLGLAFGLISLCCCCGPVFGPLSILFGVLGLFKDEDRSLAIIGLVLGIIGTVCGILFWLVVWPALTAPPPEE